jgi:hypothetical protein
MKYGMLWFDNNPKTTLEAKVERAASYYNRKYGSRPNTAVVSPEAMDGKRPKVEGIKVEKNRQILPGHIWLGIREKEKK